MRVNLQGKFRDKIGKLILIECNQIYSKFNNQESRLDKVREDIKIQISHSQNLNSLKMLLHLLGIIINRLDRMK